MLWLFGLLLLWPSCRVGALISPTSCVPGFRAEAVDSDCAPLSLVCFWGAASPKVFRAPRWCQVVFPARLCVCVPRCGAPRSPSSFGDPYGPVSAEGPPTMKKPSFLRNSTNVLAKVCAVVVVFFLVFSWLLCGRIGRDLVY